MPKPEQQMRVLLIDIETAPSLGYVWDLWNQNVSLKQLESVTEVMCFAAKWMGERGTMFYSTFKDGHKAMIKAAHKLLTQADVVVHYNGKRFDVPHLNREFLLMGLAPPAPYQQMDLYQTVKRRFKFVSNKLEHVSRQLGLDGKVEHEGFELWKKCMKGDPAAWKRMERYNRRDVTLLEDVYTQLQPWIPQHPNKALIEGKGSCPVCGGTHLQSRGFAYTQSGKYRRFQCQACGAWHRSNKREAGSRLVQAQL